MWTEFILYQAKRVPQVAYGLSKLALHKARRAVLTEIDHLLNQVLGRSRLLQKEAAKYDCYYKILGRISDVGFRLEYHATVRPRAWWKARFEQAGLRPVDTVMQAIQGSEVYRVRGEALRVEGSVVPVQYFVYEKVRPSTVPRIRWC